MSYKIIGLIHACMSDAVRTHKYISIYNINNVTNGHLLSS